MAKMTVTVRLTDRTYHYLQGRMIRDKDGKPTESIDSVIRRLLNLDGG